MANIFQKVAVPKVHFSNFNLTHEYKCSMDMGYLVPIQCIECLPNDTFQGSTEAFIRFAPMKFPVFDRINCKIYNFFVPNRLLWKYWGKFIAERPDDDLPAIPFCYPPDFVSAGNSDVWHINSLPDYLGLPVSNTFSSFDDSDERISVLPFMAYQKVWNDYFRDENLQQDLFSDDGAYPCLSDVFDAEGQITSFESEIFDMLFALRKKAWEKDYFTSALPDPQLGDPVPVPVEIRPGSQIAGDVDFRGNPNITLQGSGYKNQGNVINNAGSLAVSSDDSQPDNISGFRGKMLINVDDFSDNQGSFSINDLRLASAIQRFRELLSRAGHRYKETILSMFNQVTPDYRLDRPQFISSANIPVQISDIPQTSSTITSGTDQSAQGTLAGKGTVAGNQGFFKYHCQEHGFLLTLACVLPRTSYQNGLSRMWTRMDRYDYYSPMFENLGEQAIKMKELDFKGYYASDNIDFGYAPRYSDYKYIPSSVHGEFRSGESLDFMTLSRDCQDAKLNGDFITPDDETMNRPFAVESGVSHLYCQFVNHTLARRPMQKNPIPKLI